MAKSQLPQRLDLRILALYIERDMLNVEQKKYLATAIRAVAEGESAADSFGIKRAPNRPKAERTRQIVTDIFLLTGPSWGDYAGVSITTAIHQVADGLSLSSRTVKNAYYSPDGKKILQELTPRPTK